MASTDLVQAYALASSRLAATLDAAVSRTWAATVLGLDQRSAQRWTAAIVPLVEAAKTETAVNTNAYLAASVAETLRRPPRPRPLDVRAVTGSIRGDVDPGTVYHRPIATARSYAKAGYPLSEALRQGQRRARTIAATDLQLARTHTTRAVIGDDERVVGYRRVLTGSESCGLCITASTQRYHRGELMPIHPGCDCGVAPIVGTDDPGRVINRDLLDEARAQGIGPTRTTVYRHGEYGPTLAREGDRQLTSPAARHRPDLAKFSSWDRRSRLADAERDWAAEVGAVEEAVEVASGPSDPDIGRPTGPGVAWVTADNRLFFVEYPDDPDRLVPRQLRFQAARDVRLKRLLEAEAQALPAGFTGPRVVMSVQGSSASDAALSARYGMQFVTAANAGHGRVVHFHGNVIPDVVWHETGHIVATEINQLAAAQVGISDAVVNAAPRLGWNGAARLDAKHLARLDLRNFEGGGQRSGQHRVSPTGEALWSGGGELTPAVTDYGAVSPTEDFAEAWRLRTQDAVTGAVGTYQRADGFYDSISFAEMFPNRVDYFDRLGDELGVDLAPGASANRP